MCYGETQAVSDFTLAIESGEFVTIIGSSGCGKTTLLKTVNALIPPTSGRVLVMGEDTRTAEPVALRRRIGYVIQGGVLFPHMTVEENIAYVPRLIAPRDRQAAREAVSKWMGIVGLEDSLKSRYPSRLSGGQQQRVGIARALAASPKLLLMDEPFSAVDEITRLSLQTEIARIHRETGITVLFVTHDISEAVRLGSKVLVMNAGRLQQYDSPERIAAAPANEYVKALFSRAAV